MTRPDAPPVRPETAATGTGFGSEMPPPSEPMQWSVRRPDGGALRTVTPQAETPMLSAADRASLVKQGLNPDVIEASLRRQQSAGVTPVASHAPSAP